MNYPPYNPDPIVKAQNDKISLKMYSSFQSGFTLPEVAKQFGFTNDQTYRRMVEYCSENTLQLPEEFYNFPEETEDDLNVLDEEKEMLHMEGQYDEETKTINWRNMVPVDTTLVKGKDPDAINSLIVDMFRLTNNDRNQIYGDFHTNMKIQGEIMEVLEKYGLKRYSRSHNSCIELLANKLARMAQGDLHRDNYVDGANYLLQSYVSEVKEGKNDKCQPEGGCTVSSTTDGEQLPGEGV